MDLIAEYLVTVREISDINHADFGNKETVKTNNGLADKLRAVASEINIEYPEMKSDFYQLLFHDNPDVRLCAAHHILEVMNFGDECRARALQEIKYVSAFDKSINGLGNKMWLEQWFAQHPEDANLL